ncbi:MAG: tRNA lysidine(34) synthetase TilS [Candidatus Omnitrophica bacterium]|nr:tRNA lysidine(34) synthetase TilS [Candidatus Omnitrophota bacterium]
MTTIKNQKISRVMGEISKKVGQAIFDYEMLKEGDKVIVAVSGGKDSLCLLKLLQYRQTFIPIDFEILAVHVDYGIPGFPVEKIESYCQSLEIPFHREKIDILKDKTMEELNCFWCSWNRRKALFQLADKLGFNKVALGHHMDDIVETILMNMFFKGEISAMKPNQDFFKGKLAIIRPLAYIYESQIIQMVKKECIPVIEEYTCPHNDTTMRIFMKKTLAQLESKIPKIKQNIFNSLQNIKDEYLLDKTEERKAL